MAYKPLVTAWRESQQTRTPIQTGLRVASIENDLTEADQPAPNMKPGRSPGWRNLFTFLDDPEADGPEVTA